MSLRDQAKSAAVGRGWQGYKPLCPEASALFGLSCFRLEQTFCTGRLVEATVESFIMFVILRAKFLFRRLAREDGGHRRPISLCLTFPEISYLFRQHLCTDRVGCPRGKENGSDEEVFFVT
jgi:hypothetical protein